MQKFYTKANLMEGWIDDWDNKGQLDESSQEDAEVEIEEPVVDAAPEEEVPVEVEAPEEENEEVKNTALSALLADEKEAIEGYNDAIDELKDAGELTDNAEETLKHISDEELEHIGELAELVGETTNEEEAPVEESLQEAVDFDDKAMTAVADGIEPDVGAKEQIEEEQCITLDDLKVEAADIYHKDEDGNILEDDFNAGINAILDLLDKLDNPEEVSEEAVEEVTE